MKNSELQSLTRHFQKIMADPSNYDAAFSIARIHYGHQQYQQALTYFSKAYENNHNSATSAQYIGNIYYYQHQDETAIHWYEISIKINPHNDSAYNSIGVIKKRTGKIQESITAFEKCLQINPKNSLAHYGIGNIYYDNKSYEQSLLHFNLSVEANPSYDAPYIGRGNVYRTQGKIQEASQQYCKSIYLNPNNQAALKNLRYLPQKQKTGDELSLSEVEPAYQAISQLSNSESFSNKLPNPKPNKPQRENSQSHIKPIKKIQSMIRKPAQHKQETTKNEEGQIKNELKLMRQQFTSMIYQLSNCFNKMDISQTNSIEKANKDASHVKKNQSHLSARDRELIIEMSHNGQDYDSKTVQSWLLKMMNQVVSTSFNFYLNSQMTYNQARIYCCEKILTNIYIFVSKGHKTILPSFMYKINKFMEESLQYIKYKYPLNEELEVPYKIEHFISSNKKDNTDSIQYDYFYHYPYEYQYRQSGIYNDVIMRMINNLINTTNTNYYSFKETMTNLFQNVFDPNWKKEEAEEQGINKGKNVQRDRNQSPTQTRFHAKSPPHIHKMVSQPHIQPSNSEISAGILNMTKTLETPDHQVNHSQNARSQHPFQEKRKEERQANRKKRQHRQKVQAYTSYAIKRKIPQFVKCYTQEQIRNINILKIKDKSIFRILTKWCQQLWEKFDISGYFLNKVSIIMLKDKKLFYISHSHKEELNSLIMREKVEIKRFIEKISKDCNMKMQFHLLTRWLVYEDDIENNTGIFTANVVESLQYFTVSYLNRLIHGLLKVSKRFSERLLDESHPELLLLTFRIKDLLRCRFKSKEEESEKVLRHILQETQIAVLRVKNRLNDNNNDIMINLFFEKMICEIQLAVQTNTSRFIECSNNFNHFLYELQRSYFGPITEMSNIWQCHDKRMKYYKKVQEKRIEAFKAKPNSCSHSFERIDQETEPFICSCCNRIYYHYNFIISHKRCIICKSINCGNCRLTNMSDQQLKKYFSIDFTSRYTDPLQQFPQLSYFLIKQSSYDQIGVFYIRYQKRCKRYLISIKKSENGYHFQLITQLNDKNVKNLLKKYVIVVVPHIYEHVVFKKSIEQTLFSEYVKQTLTQEKDELSLSDFSIDSENLRHILERELKAYKINQNYCKVKKLIIDRMSQGKIKKQSIDHIVSDFSNLRYLWIANNHLDCLPKFKNPSQIAMINLQRTDIKELERYGHIQHFESLQFLIINNSHLKQLPQSLKNILTLVHLEICSSDINHLHESLFKHLGSTLLYLNLSNNKLEKLPDSIKDLKKLQYLNVSDNKLQFFPAMISANTSLTYLNLSGNSLRRIPQQLHSLVNLQILDLSGCDISNVFAEISRLVRLKKINLSTNKLKSISFLRNSKVSKEILLSYSCQQMPQHQSELLQLSYCEKIVFTNLYLGKVLIQIKFSHIVELTISACGIYVFPNLKECHSLTLLDLSKNHITKICESDVQGLSELKELILSENPLSMFLQDLRQLEKLQVLELDQCGLSGVPILANAQALTSLRLSRNKFTQISNDFFKALPNLKVLDLGDNQVRSEIVTQKKGIDQQSEQIKKEPICLKIGDRIDLLSNLSELYLCNCKIKEVPQNIEKCQELTVLRLEKNQISLFPKFLSSLTKLQVLRIDSNNMSRMKDLQILNISHKVLPSMIILREILNSYQESLQDKQEQTYLQLFAVRLGKQIKEAILDRQGQVILKYGEQMIEDIRLVHVLLRIESEYSVISDYLNKIIFMIDKGVFCEKYLSQMKENFVKRLCDIENEEFTVLTRNELNIQNYQVCYRELTISFKHFKKEESENIQNCIKRLFKDNINFQKILNSYNEVRPIFFECLQELVDLQASRALNLQASIRYYPHLQEIAMPVDIKEIKVVGSEEETPVCEALKSLQSKYPFLRFNAAITRKNALEKAYFILGTQTRLINSHIRQ